MAGEANRVYAPDFVMVDDGMEVTGGAMSEAPDKFIDLNNHLNYIYCDVILDIEFDTDQESNIIHIYRWDLDVYNDKDTQKPSTGFQHKYVGSMSIDVTGTTTKDKIQTLVLYSVPLSRKCKFMFLNPGDSVSDKVIAGWKLIIRPWAIGPWV